MLLRVGSLATLAALAALEPQLQRETDNPEWQIWAGVATTYGLCVLLAWWIDRKIGAKHAGWVQLTVDTVLAAIVVQFSGGIDSAFTFLYLVSIAGAATHASRTQTWASFGACALIYSAMSLLQLFGWVSPLGQDIHANINPDLLWLAIPRNLGAMLAVSLFADSIHRRLQIVELAKDDAGALHTDIVDSLQSGLLTLDPQGHIGVANPAAIELLNLPEDYSGQKVETLLQNCTSKIRSTSVDSPLVLSVRTKDRPRHLECYATPLLDKNQQCLGDLLQIHDRSEVKRLQQELAYNERMAAIGELAAMVAHEVRNPLAAMSGCMELLEVELEPQEDQKIRSIIAREIKRLNITVEQLLHHTKTPILRSQRGDLSQTVHEIVEAFGQDPKRVDLKIHIESPPSIPAHFDTQAIAQLLWNLLRNAADAQNNRGQIDLRCDLSDCVLHLEVCDQGPGFDLGAGKQVFEPYYSKKRNGSGLGLAIVAQIVRAHQGEIEILNRSEGGARFIVRWPLQPPAKPVAKPSSADAQNQPANRPPNDQAA